MQPISTLLAPAEPLVVPAHGADAPPDTRRRFALEVEDAPEALERVLGRLRVRRCRVTDVAFAATPGGPAHLVVGVEPPPERAHLVEQWLTGIHAVRSCEAIGA
jgi:acetolactate synthase regulatory subunit